MAAGSRTGFLLGLTLFAGYFALMAAPPSLPILVVAQVARGIAIAVVGALGITYFQDLLPDSTGRATTLFSDTVAGGSLIAGIVAGSAAQAVGYRAALLLCGFLAAAAWAVLVGARVHGGGRRPPWLGPPGPGPGCCLRAGFR